MCSLSLSTLDCTTSGILYQEDTLGELKELPERNKLQWIKMKSSLTISESPNPWSLLSPHCASSHLYCLPVSPMLFGPPDEVINPQGETRAPLFWQLPSQSQPRLDPPQSWPYPPEMFTVFPELFFYGPHGESKGISTTELLPGISSWEGDAGATPPPPPPSWSGACPFLPQRGPGPGIGQGENVSWGPLSTITKRILPWLQASEDECMV